MTDTLTPPGRRRLVPRLLRETTFRRYWSAQTVSMFGDQITLLAIPLLAVLTVGAGPAEMGYLTAAALVPNLVFSLIAGAWVDRFPHKRHIMIAADLGRAALLLSVPLLAWADLLTLPYLYVFAFAAGTLAMFFEVAHSSLFVSLVRRPDYVDANSLVNGSRAMSYVAGPSVGGVLVQWLTAPVALLADVLSYLASALFLTRIKPVERPVETREGLGLGAGLRFVVRSAVLRSLLLGTTTLNLFNYIFAALFVLYVTTDLGVTPGTLGIIIGAGSVGGLLGAVVTSRVARRFGIGPTLVAGFVVFPAPLILVPLADGTSMPVVLTLLLISEFLSALGVMMLDITAGSIQTAATPDSMLALVQGAKRTVNYGIRPIGALIGGALGTALGVLPALWIATIGAVAGTLWVLFSPIATMRELPES
ncbi:MFS transporter [Spirilliplanes yamanashiensis]|uniref:MFS transporter n=1 Tax=Spirilliplanes yamanashiensis TaxID=42233 RepID=A0A8J4DJ11_9ACTN|nr:MFS transporter [Spirilliplanes yamanashiensis]MDP9815417.1 MFS family permease [Spirilliplanes yamanashiensis]GIJ03672.1 MFS transporter [Spirilliplanes yamanashiensis]